MSQKTTAQSKRPRKAPSNQTGGTAWGKKAAAAISGKMQSADVKKLILLNFPYIIAFYMVEKAAWLYRYCNGDTIVDRLMVLFMNFGLAYKSYLPSFHPFDLLVGLIGAAALKAMIYFKGKNAKKYRQGEEYGSARWGNAKDIEPFIDPVFENNVLLTQTERLMMSGRPKHPKYARNKNVIVIGGSGSGKTRFFVKPNLMQMPEKVSYVCTDPKGTIIIECGKMLSDAGYKIKVLNTINFKKSMHYNPFHYIRSEKDILKLVNTIIANTKGDGEKSSEDFWVKAERLLYCALIGYIYYEAPAEEQNFSTLLEFINASEAREDDEEFKNPVDELFEDLEKAKPEHFAVRQYKKYKLAAEGAKREYDYILLDCMPSLGMLTINALAAADAALIPMQAQYLSAKGLEQLLQTVQKVRRQINPKLKIEGILLTMTDSRTNYGKQISSLIRQAYGKHLKVFEQTIPRSVRAAETSAAGKSIFAYDPKGKVAEAYKSLAKEVLADANRQRKLSSERAR